MRCNGSDTVTSLHRRQTYTLKNRRAVALNDFESVDARFCISFSIRNLVVASANASGRTVNEVEKAFELLSQQFSLSHFESTENC